MHANVEQWVKDPVFKYSNALTIGYLDGLSGRDPRPEMEATSDRYADAWLLGAADREAGVPNKTYMGYYPTSELPVKRGDTVIIKKGTLVHCNGETKPAGRTYRVKVHHVMNGQNYYDEGSGHRQVTRLVKPPTVVWPGTGGYWAEADINDVTVVTQ